MDELKLNYALFIVECAVHKLEKARELMFTHTFFWLLGKPIRFHFADFVSLFPILHNMFRM